MTAQDQKQQQQQQHVRLAVQGSLQVVVAGVYLLSLLLLLKPLACMLPAAAALCVAEDAGLGVLSLCEVT